MRLQNDRFNWAIDHMQQGLCMFDADRRLAVFNRRYAEMYNLPPGEIRIGQTLEEVLDCRAAAGACRRRISRNSSAGARRRRRAVAAARMLSR